jgi:diguanylate cyclase (GGDEF)-like protein
MKPLLNSINLKKYLPFFQDSAGYPCALGLSSDDGLIQLAHESETEDFELLRTYLENHDNHKDSVSQANQNIIDFGPEGTIVTIALMMPNCDRMLMLTGLLKFPADKIDSAQRVKAINTLDKIADCIVDECTMHLTLSDMVRELTVRYEELNLLYGLDDSDAFQNPLDEQQALLHLLNNCSDYLNVDLAFLYLPELKINLHKLNTSHPEFDLLITLQTIQYSIYNHIVKETKPLVINQNEDKDWIAEHFDSPNKFIVAPIMLTKHSLAGVLVLVNSPVKPDFSNSDRKLCEVLASEAAKLIQARRDIITGLVNRRGFTEKINQALNTAKLTDTKFSLLYIDIDQFRVINDTSGQKAGDQLLNHVTSLISGAIGHGDLIGRLGADEFGVLLNNRDLSEAGQFAESLRQQINQFRFSWQDKLYDISVCIGVVELKPDTEDSSIPLSSAELACSVAKEQGRDRVHSYNPSDKDMIRHENEMHWVSRIHRALEEERFLLYRQKIQPLNPVGNAEEHYEILIRLKDENGNLVPPFNFIPAAERYNLMSKLDRWVVITTLAKLAAALEKEPTSSLSYSINLSGQSFCEPEFVEFIIEQIIISGVQPHRVCFEITETAAVSNLQQTIKFMETLKSYGCYFSLDDFGSGMSSFTYLKNLPVDYLKIDGYFVKTMLLNPVDYAMVKSIHDIGKVMGLKTIAEFVEDDNIFQELKLMGVDYGQGYGIAKPEPFY